MHQLSGIDASFLNAETSSAFTHVASMTVYDPSGAAEGGGYEAMRALILEHLDDLDLFRRRLVEVPLGLDLPYWIDDPDFDIDFHVRHLALPAPGNDEQLGEQVARLVGRPLDRSRPLWELYVIEGLEGGRIAQLTKIHHATIDGASGAELLSTLLERDPGHRPSGQVATWHPEQAPSDLELLQRTALAYLRRPEKVVRLNVRMLRQLAAATRSGGLRAMADLVAQPLPGPLGETLRQRLRGGQDVDTPPALPLTPAPRTVFNRSITPHRRFAFTSIPLDEAKTVKSKLGTTFNDVVMALCSATLRRYLDERGVLPDEPLIAMVPVSIRSGAEGDPYQNRVSAMFCNLATDVADPVERLLAIHGAMKAAKEMHAAMPAELLQDYTLFAPPALAARAMRLYSRTRIADRMNPPFNLIISNVPGPSEPLYLAGGRLLHFYPVSAVVDGQGLNMTVQSYNGSLDFGFIACRELVPDLWDMTGYLRDAMQELLDAV
jgi:WS/DGAT/MGAT family acyltransferase